MKRLLPALLLLAALLPTACQSVDDDPNLPPEDSLTNGGEKEWQIIAKDVNGNDVQMGCCDDYYKVYYRADGSWSATWKLADSDRFCPGRDDDIPACPYDQEGTWSFYDPDDRFGLRFIRNQSARITVNGTVVDSLLSDTLIVRQIRPSTFAYYSIDHDNNTQGYTLEVVPEDQQH